MASFLLVFSLIITACICSRYVEEIIYGPLEAKQQIYTQTLDHFDKQNHAKFKQRWFYYDSFWSGPSQLGPIIFQCGGEGTNHGHFYGFVQEYAQQIGALLITVEHRFYGQSKPHKKHHKKFKYLNFKQAMIDYVELMLYIKAPLSSIPFKHCPLCPVLVFGASYSGELAIWLRMKYPQIFDMALGSSAPIYYSSNNYHYNKIRSASYYEIVTNAVYKISPECVEYVKVAYDALLRATKEEVIEKIPICKGTYRGLDEFLALLYEKWANLAMANYPPATSPLKRACQRIEDGSKEDGLSIWSRFLLLDMNENGCLNMNHGTYHCGDLTGCGHGEAAKNWDYQTCTTHIQPFSTNGKTDMFPVYDWSLDWLDEHCWKRFKVKASEWKNKMTLEYGDATEFDTRDFAQSASRIIFSNGLQDGWNAGGVMQSMSDSLIAIVIPHGAHYSDMRRSSPLDTLDVIKARQRESEILTEWILQIQNERRYQL